MTSLLFKSTSPDPVNPIETNKTLTCDVIFEGSQQIEGEIDAFLVPFSK